MKKHYLLLCSAILAVSMLSNCQKSTTSDSDISEAALDNITTQSTIADVASADVQTKVLDGSLLSADVNANARTVDSSTTPGTYVITENDGAVITITKTNGAFPITVKRDFTKTSTTDTLDGLKRGGIMTTVYTGRVRGRNATVGATATTTFDSYKIDSVLISGIVVLTNTTGADSIPTFTMEEKDFKLTLPSNEVLTRNGTITTRMTAGKETIVRLDDVFETTGALTVVSSTGSTWTTTIASSNPIVRSGKCHGGRRVTTGTINVAISKNNSTTTSVMSTIEYGAKGARPNNDCNPNKPRVRCGQKGIDKERNNTELPQFLNF